MPRSFPSNHDRHMAAREGPRDSRRFGGVVGQGRGRLQVAGGSKFDRTQAVADDVEVLVGVESHSGT
jgi:hypothetical protein